MNKTIKANWVAALRSGHYKQGQEELCGDGRYCCLGVLCDLAAMSGVIQDEYRRGFPDFDVDGWAGLTNYQVAYKGGKTHLSILNDDEHLTFPQIADLIEADEEL